MVHLGAIRVSAVSDYLLYHHEIIRTANACHRLFEKLKMTFSTHIASTVSARGMRERVRAERRCGLLSEADSS